MTKGVVSSITGFILAAALPLLLAACQSTKAATPAPPPPDVTVAEVVKKDVPIASEWIATLDGYVNAQVRPQVSGYLVKRNYREGAAVRAGDVLFEIDPRPFEATLAQAKAQLAQAEAQLGRTERDVERDTPLAREKAIAQSQLDNDIQANLAAQATVESARGAAPDRAAQRRLHEGHVARGRRRRHRHRSDRRSRRTDHAADDRLADLADQGVLPRQRAGVSARGRAAEQCGLQPAALGSRRGSSSFSATAASIRRRDRSWPRIARSISRPARSA